MKKIALLAFVLSAAAHTASAQFYLRLGLGYAIPQAGQTLDGTGQPFNGTGTNGANVQSYNIRSASFSAGVQSSIGAGYMFSEHVGVQLDMAIGLATKKYTFSQDSVVFYGVESSYNVVQQAKTPVLLTPSLVLQTGDDRPLNLYSRFGMVVPLNTKVTQDQVEDNLPNTGSLQDLDFTLAIKSRFSIGFAAAAGVKYKISDRISLWGEASLLSMSVFIKEEDLVAVTYNGSGQPLSSVSGPQVVKYAKKGTIDSADAATYSQPFSNVGINVGVTINLGQKRNPHHSRNSDDDNLIDNNKPYKRR